MGLLATSLVDAAWFAVKDYPWCILECLEFDSRPKDGQDGGDLKVVNTHNKTHLTSSHSPTTGPNVQRPETLALTSLPSMNHITTSPMIAKIPKAPKKMLSTFRLNHFGLQPF